MQEIDYELIYNNLSGKTNGKRFCGKSTAALHQAIAYVLMGQPNIVFTSRDQNTSKVRRNEFIQLLIKHNIKNHGIFDMKVFAGGSRVMFLTVKELEKTLGMKEVFIIDDDEPSVTKRLEILKSLSKNLTDKIQELEKELSSVNRRLELETR